MGLKNHLTPIYPHVYSEIASNTLTLKTLLRKKHRGVYFLTLHKVTYVLDSSSPLIRERQILNTTSRFHSQVYMDILLGKISPGLRSIQGLNLHERDTNQISEKERLFKLIK